MRGRRACVKEFRFQKKGKGFFLNLALTRKNYVLQSGS
ncbi:hypothetical protein LEP1GSC050_3189 [Leptospira broomii serovar Hurstbridge str. 5399]|uniref:Uncharacterized protein n=1 Tax=Leptospira broomii serovar Hurstbridge str. 5399 TaxID=1049789 RepID=T0EZJ2_9LEPT|nr:hypothetical protein LEP1GSC050_3189 [Leptospira broomii serovar Hurstbridge str. 5399]